MEKALIVMAIVDESKMVFCGLASQRGVSSLTGIPHLSAIVY